MPDVDFNKADIKKKFCELSHGSHHSSIPHTLSIIPGNLPFSVFKTRFDNVAIKMTVTYNAEIHTVSYLGFLKLLLR